MCWLKWIWSFRTVCLLALKLLTVEDMLSLSIFDLKRSEPKVLAIIISISFLLIGDIAPTFYGWSSAGNLLFIYCFLNSSSSGSKVRSPFLSCSKHKGVFCWKKLVAVLLPIFNFDGAKGVNAWTVASPFEKVYSVSLKTLLSFKINL